ncbi:hypothetical protein TNCV_3324481 [Trichonephila clavipes]|nr:hypothetical protein TNCV_3324481 [Trichonephila clavipes]
MHQETFGQCRMPSFPLDRDLSSIYEFSNFWKRYQKGRDSGVTENIRGSCKVRSGSRAESDKGMIFLCTESYVFGVSEALGLLEPCPFSSDEAHFWLNGYVNKQNCRIWSEANPQVYVETPLHPEKLTVWYALWAGGILLQKR